MPTEAQVREIAAAFQIKGNFTEIALGFGGGHINSTCRLEVADVAGKKSKYILQRINRNAFKDPVKVMDNVVHVTEHLRRKFAATGRDPARETLTFLPTADGLYYHIDTEGEYWRCYDYVDDVYTLQLVENPEDLREAGRAFGRFQRMLTDFPAKELHDTIPNFHNTKLRIKALERAIYEDVIDRNMTCQAEIEFASERTPKGGWLVDRMEAGILPQRVTHNDTKINNVLFDCATHEALCVIDLDTVMPGLVAYDFGDGIRFGASTALEDEHDLDKVRLDLDLYRAFAEGFLGECGELITEAEHESLLYGAYLMTYTIGVRFLTDYLAGDVYFRTAYPKHNLVRARTQFKLVAEIERHWNELEAIMESLRK